jgi:stage III sporulation protein AF
MPLRQWLQNLVILVFVVVFLETMLPKSSIRGFVQLVIGLVLIAAMLEPMLALTGLSINWELPASGRLESVSLEAGLSLRQRALARLRGDYVSRLNDQAAAFLAMTPGVEDATVQAELSEGRIDRVIVWLQLMPGERQEAWTEKVVPFIAQFYGLSHGAVDVQYREGGSNGAAR